MNNISNDLNKDIIEVHFKTLLALVIDSMPGVVAGTQYILKRLVGMDEWEKFPRKFRRQLGIKFSAHIKENMMPLKYISKDGSNSNLYTKH
jgi:hypothetical protein